MSTALYRRYRSPDFASLIGQEHIAITLRNEVAGDRLAHAYLFTGIRGTGKTSTARILARAVNCLERNGGEPCNRCIACTEISSGAAVDVLEIDAASNRGIDEMRDLRDKVKYLPASLRCKVYIIDEAHMLTTEAWNAFLKTLEEPPPHVLFVLATTEPHKVPETVRSRVQRFDFRRVVASQVVEHLRWVASQETVQIDDDALDLLARTGQGSVRDSLSLLDQAIAAGSRPLTLVATRRALGLADPELVRDMMIALGGADAATALRAAAATLAAGADPRHLLREGGRLARNAALAAVGCADDVELTAPDRDTAANLAALADQGFWVDALDALSATEINLRQPVDARLQVELCLLRLSRRARTDTATIDDLARRVAALEAAGRSPAHEGTGGALRPEAPTATPTATRVVPPVGRADSAPTTEAAQPGPVDPASWAKIWPLLVEAVNRDDAMLAGVLRSCSAHDADASRLVIATPGSFHFDRLSEPPKLALLHRAVASIAGGPRDVIPRFDDPRRSSAAASEAPPADLTHAVLEAFPGSRVTTSRLRDRADEERSTP